MWEIAADNLGDAPALVQGDLFLHRLGGGQCARHKHLERRIADELIECLALRLDRIDAANFRSSLVDADDVVAAVYRQHAFDHTRQHGLLLVSLAQGSL